MRTGERLVVLIIMRALGEGDDFQLLAALIEFLDSFNRLTSLALLTPTGAQSSVTVAEGAGVASGAARNGGAVLAGTANAATAGDADATVVIFNANDEPAESGANLTISKTDYPPDKVATGAEVVYTVKVFNQGPDVAENVVLTDTLPSNSISNRDSLPDKCIENGRQVICNLGTVLVGGVGVSKVFKVRAPAERGVMANHYCPVKSRIESAG